IAIIGSANINERSMLGSRDSECAAVVRDTDMLWSTMNENPYLVGRFPHTLRMRLMREHLGIDVDAVMEEERAEDEFEHDMDEVYGDHPRHHSDSLAQLETEERLLQSRSEIQEDLLAKSEKLHSFNFDVDWEQGDNPNLRSGKKLTEDARVTGNAEHQKDVDGEGPDQKKREEDSGRAAGRDTFLAPNGKETFTNLHPTGVPERSLSPSEIESRKRSTSNLSSSHVNAAPPSQNLEDANTEKKDLPHTAQLPTLPTTDDTDIGGPPLQRDTSTRSSIHPFVADMKRPSVDKDCMRDPLNDAFFLDTWHAVAENNTRLYRTVFRCMPDNEVKSWKEYKEYAAYAERFAQAQGGGKSKDRLPQEVSSSSGPPGQGSTADRLRMLGPVGEKAGDAEAKAEAKTETIGDKVMKALPLTSKDEPKSDRSLSKLEEWAEEANIKQTEREKDQNDMRQESPISGETATDEKAALQQAD
ncbi:MAG: hypothetical protein Q9174_007282, partial [Haloplaca sp. 1 TL-2023]